MENITDERINFLLPIALHNRLKEAAEKYGIGKSKIIRAALEAYLEAMEAEMDITYKEKE